MSQHNIGRKCKIIRHYFQGETGVIVDLDEYTGEYLVKLDASLRCLVASNVYIEQASVRVI